VGQGPAQNNSRMSVGDLVATVLTAKAAAAMY